MTSYDVIRFVDVDPRIDSTGVIIQTYRRFILLPTILDFNMKFACFALLVALLFVSARADNARKHRPVSLKFQCPLSTRYFKENLDAKQYTKKCLRTWLSCFRV